MNEKKRITIEIPADVMEAAVAEVRHLERFSGLSEVENIREHLIAGTNKAQQKESPHVSRLPQADT